MTYALAKIMRAELQADVAGWKRLFTANLAYKSRYEQACNRLSAFDTWFSKHYTKEILTDI
jgi:hypothetical protein